MPSGLTQADLEAVMEVWRLNARRTSRQTSEEQPDDQDVEDDDDGFQDRVRRTRQSLRNNHFETPPKHSKSQYLAVFQCVSKATFSRAMARGTDTSFCECVYQYGSTTTTLCLQEAHQFFVKEMRALQRNACLPSGLPVVELVDERDTYSYTVLLRVRTDTVAAFLRESWGLDGEFIELHVTNVNKVSYRNIGCGAYGATMLRPQVVVPDEFHTCIVAHQLANLARDYIHSHYVVAREADMDPDNHPTFFSNLLLEMERRLCCLTEYCVMCNKALPAAGLLPSICVSELCTFQSRELKLYDGLTAPRMSPEVMELLIVLLSRANDSEDSGNMLNRKRALQSDPTACIPKCPELRLIQYWSSESESEDEESEDEEDEEEETQSGRVFDDYSDSDDEENSPNMSAAARAGISGPRWHTTDEDYRQSQIPREVFDRQQARRRVRRQVQRVTVEEWTPVTPSTGRREQLPDAHIGRDVDSTTWNQQTLLHTFIASVPCTRRILASAVEYDKFRWERPRAAALLEWLVISLPAYLHQLPRNLHVDAFNCEHQFLVFADTPAKHARFQELKEQHGGETRFIFHGSPISNWHNILRTGLKNYSHTELEATGTVHGEGIYLSNKLSQCIQYAKRQQLSDRSPSLCSSECCRGKHPMATRASIVVAVCEVVPHGLCPTARSDYFTVKDEDFICVRMLLVFEQSDPNNSYPDITDDDCSKIRKTLQALTRDISYAARQKLLQQTRDG